MAESGKSDNDEDEKDGAEAVEEVRVSHARAVDIVVLTVIPEELSAAREALGLGATENRWKDHEQGTVYYEGRVHSELTRRNYRVVLTCIGRAGNTSSASAVAEVVGRFQPKAVLLMGIAAGLRGKVKIGDVVVSERVVATEPAAAVRAADGTRAKQPRPEIRTTPYRMHQDVVNYAPPTERLDGAFSKMGWEFPGAVAGKEADFAAHVATGVQVKLSTIASGEKLVRDPREMEDARDLHGKVEVYEMEAAGLMEACERLGMPWLVIRGISDFGDAFKDDRFHDFAARTAAIVLTDFVAEGLDLARGPWRLSRSTRAAGAAVVMATLVLGGYGLRSTLLTSTQSTARCGHDFGVSPFKEPKATHFLIADFYGPAPASEQNFGDRVSTQVTEALRQFKEEELPKLDIQVPPGSLEIQRLSCFLESHEHADEAAKALEADVVIWGQAFCNAQSPVQVKTQVGDIHAEAGAQVKAGNVEVHGTPYTVCPRATLYRSERDYHGSERGMIDLASIGHLDLPALRATEPFRLVEFALGLHFYEVDNYWLAARFFERSAEHVTQGEKNLFALDVALGFIYSHDPKFFSQSLEHNRRALAVVEGTGTREEAKLLNNIGSVLHDQGDLPGALVQFKRALAILEKALGAEHPNVAATANNIGSVLNAQGDLPGALVQFKRALVIDEKARGPEHPSTAIDIINIGSVLNAQGDLPGALVQFKRALAIDEKALGPEHPSTARDVNNIGNVLHAQGDLPGALAQYKRALAIDEKALGPEHPSTAIDVNNIGSVLNAQGDLAGALVQFKRALAIKEKALGADHPKVAATAHNIGGVLQAQGDLAGALVQFKRALAIFEKSLGADHPNTRNSRKFVAATLAMQNGWDPNGTKGGAVVRCTRSSCAGLETGDWITSYGTTKIRDSTHLPDLLKSTSPTTTVRLTLVRNQKSMTLTVPGGPLGIELM